MQFHLITLFVGLGIIVSPFVSGKQEIAELECPPQTPVRVCDNSACSTDSDCRDNKKCCPTDCGGNYCVQPVTPRNHNLVKRGLCPTDPKSTWLCTSRCDFDSDCKGSRKCCRNRCGARDCLDPVL